MLVSPIPAVALQAAEAAGWRRALHAMPELSGVEFETAQFVADRLRSFGVVAVTDHLCGAGVIGVVDGLRGPGKTLLFRAELDGLPIQETGQPAHVSQRPGRMHACGHDGHMAILLTLAKHLSQNRGFFGRVVCLFQPSEEQGDGARSLVADGLLDRLGVDEIYALHNWPGLPVGRFGIAAGAVMAAFDTVRIELVSAGGHGALLDPALNLAAAAARIASAVSTHEIPSEGLFRLTVTSIVARGSFNIVPAQAEILGSLRSTLLDPTATMATIEQLARQAAGALGPELRFEHRRECDPVVNDSRCAQIVSAAVDRAFGPHAIAATGLQAASDDAGFLLAARPGAFVLLGAGDVPALHMSDYDFPDEIIELGLRLWLGIVQSELGLQHGTSDHD